MTAPAAAPDPVIAEVPSPAVAGLEAQLAQLFAAGRRFMQSRAAAVHPDLSPGAYKVVSTLVQRGPTHAGTLAAELCVDKSAISRIIRQLEDLGLVERGADPEDGRAFLITATASTVRKVNAIRDESRGRLHRSLTDWDAADIEQLTALLAKLNRLMEPPA